MPTPDDVTATVRVLLEIAGLEVSEEELATIVETYPIQRNGADALYFEELRYEEPVTTFAPLVVGRGPAASGGAR